MKGKNHHQTWSAHPSHPPPFFPPHQLFKQISFPPPLQLDWNRSMKKERKEKIFPLFAFDVFHLALDA